MESCETRVALGTLGRSKTKCPDMNVREFCGEQRNDQDGEEGDGGGKSVCQAHECEIVF